MKFKSDQNFEINGKIIGNNSPTYFIADIAANHDGNLSRAKRSDNSLVAEMELMQPNFNILVLKH